jgi:ribosomal protein S18 acetylase RimI-like enzyme
MELSYRKATIIDAELIAQLADKIWRKHYIDIITIEQIEYMLMNMYSSESLKKQMIEGQEFTIVFDEGVACGYISISSKDKEHFFLHKFYIDTKKHRSGIGTELFAYVLTAMKSYKSIELTVNRQNYKAINFYFKNGFRIKEIADFDIGNGYFMNDFVMQKLNTEASIANNLKP